VWCQGGFDPAMKCVIRFIDMMMGLGMPPLRIRLAVGVTPWTGNSFVDLSDDYVRMLLCGIGVLLAIRRLPVSPAVGLTSRH